MKKTPFILLKITLFLLTAIFFIGHYYVHAEEIPVRERLISVNKQDQDFTQALESIADQAGITFNIHGQIPEGKRDLSMDEVPLGQAMAQVFRMYGVRNHAAAYNPETGTVMLAILETSSTLVAALSPQAQPRIDISLDEPLTPEQLERLKEQSEIIVAEIEEASRPLTPEQFERLKKKSVSIQAEIEDASQPLTFEQLSRLQEKAIQIETEFDDDKPLTSEQLSRLQDKALQIEAKFNDDEPLTSEQLLRLQEKADQTFPY